MFCVDLVGPFAIKTPLRTHFLLALTMIDPATGWFEIVQANSKTATSIQDLFHNTWLARYPRPQFTVFDNGGEFKREFKQMCENYGIKAKPTTSHNPQANAIIERIHKYWIASPVFFTLRVTLAYGRFSEVICYT
jgi:transposase InsO family protein